MKQSLRALGVILALLCTALVTSCAGDRMSQRTEEVVDDHLLANKVKVALYADKQVRGRQIAVEAAQGVVHLSGVVASPAERQRAVQLAQEVKGVKAVRQRLTVHGEHS